MTQNEKNVFKTFSNFLWVHTPPESKIEIKPRGRSIVITAEINNHRYTHRLPIASMMSHKDDIKGFAYLCAQKVIRPQL